MKYAFLLRFDKIDSLSSPGFDDREVADFLNQSQDRIFLRQYTPGANEYGQGFEMSEKRRRDLTELVSTAILTPSNYSASQTGVHANGKFVDLPTKFLYAIEEYCTFNGSTEPIPINVIEHDFYIANIRNPYKKPYKNLVWRMNVARASQGTGEESEGNAPSAKRHEIITHGPEFDTYFVRFLIEPRRIVVDEVTPVNQVSCQLDDSLHSMIVDEAVKIAVSIMQPDLYQIKTNEINSNE
jgi:hypothetical protein